MPSFGFGLFTGGTSEVAEVMGDSFSVARLVFGGDFGEGGGCCALFIVTKEHRAGFGRALLDKESLLLRFCPPLFLSRVDLVLIV